MQDVHEGSEEDEGEEAEGSPDIPPHPTRPDARLAGTWIKVRPWLAHAPAAHTWVARVATR